MVIDFSLKQDAEIYITPSSYNYGKQVDIHIKKIDYDKKKVKVVLL